MNSGKLLNGDLMYMTHILPFTHFVPQSVSYVYGDTALPDSFVRVILSVISTKVYWENMACFTLKEL